MMGLMVRSLTPNFNSTWGRACWPAPATCTTCAAPRGAAPLIGGEYDGPLYTADNRAAVTRPYRCAQCKVVQEVGPGAPWPQIAALQAAGCPSCGGTTFRPMPLVQR